MRKTANSTTALLLNITATLLATFCVATPADARRQQVKTDDYGKRYARESDRTGYAAGELLKETPLYRLHGWYKKLSDGGEYYVKWCNDYLRSATVNLVFKADDNYKVENTPAYWKRFEEEILPLITSRCPDGEVIAILNYVEGAQIEYLNRIVSRKVREGKISDALSIATYTPGAPEGRRVAWFYSFGSDENLSNILHGRNPNRRGGDAPEWGEMGDSSITSVARLRELWRDSVAKFEAAERAVAESARLREEERRRRLFAASLSKGAEVLSLYRRGAPVAFNFAGYAQQKVLQNIYLGDFEQFTGGHDPEFLESGDAKISALMLGGMAGDSSAREKLIEIGAVSRRRILIRLAYLTYHREYGEQCGLSRDIPWETPVPVRRWVARDGRTGRIVREGEPVSLPVRRPFSQTYLSIYEAMGAGGDILAGIPPETKGQFASDFRRFLRAEGCASPAVRHFEVNLHLATEWLLPLQQLPKAGLPAAQGPRPETPPAPPPADSATFEVSERLLTNFRVRRGESVTISASGSITLGMLAGNSSPDGVRGFEGYSYFREAPHGALLVRVRQSPSDDWVACGRSCSLVVERDGVLEFAVNDRDTSNNSGSYLVRVDRRRATK